MISKNLLTYKQAAALLNVPVGTMYALVSQKRIPFIKIGTRFIRFEEEVLRQWLEGRKITAVVKESEK